MEIKAFLIRFEKNLISNGFSGDTARHHTLKVAKGLSDYDKKRIIAMTEETQVDAVARSYLIRLKRRNEAANGGAYEMANTTTISNNFRGSMADEAKNVKTDEIKVYKPRADTVKSNAVTEFSDSDEYSFEDNGGETRQFAHVGKSSAARMNVDDNIKTMKIDVINQKTSSAMNDQKVDDGKTKNISKVPVKKNKLSPEAKKEFTAQILKRSPLFALGFIGAGLGALIVYALIALLIAAFITVLITVVVVGGIGTLAGLIYGIIKLFSVAPEGLYEIGFALCVAGVTMVLSICSYNVAVRAIPVLWKKFTYFLSDCLNKFKTYIRKIRKECADK